jgi:hypothetical protein
MINRRTFLCGLTLGTLSAPLLAVSIISMPIATDAQEHKGRQPPSG